MTKLDTLNSIAIGETLNPLLKAHGLPEGVYDSETGEEYKLKLEMLTFKQTEEVLKHHERQTEALESIARSLATLVSLQH